MFPDVRGSLLLLGASQSRRPWLVWPREARGGIISRFLNSGWPSLLSHALTLLPTGSSAPPTSSLTPSRCLLLLLLHPSLLVPSHFPSPFPPHTPYLFLLPPTLYSVPMNTLSFLLIIPPQPSPTQHLGNPSLSSGGVSGQLITQ